MAMGDNLEKDISRCVVRWGNTSIAECMVGGGCAWAIRSLGHGKLCSHPSVKRIDIYRPLSHALNSQVIVQG